MLLFLKTYWKTTVWMMLVAYLSLAQFDTPEIPSKIPHKDKAVHFAMYFGMCVLLLWESRGRAKKHLYWWSLGLSISFGLAMEIAQLFLNYRSGDYWDFVANSLGAASGAFFFHLLKRTRANINNTATKS